MRGASPQSLLVVAAASAAAYGLVSTIVHRRVARAPDRRYRNAIQQARHPSADAAAQATNPLGKEWLHVPAAALVSVYLARTRGRAASVIPLLTSVVSEAASRVLDRLPPTPAPPPGHPRPEDPSYPSGHALETSAVALTIAYVLAREDVVSPAPAFGAALAAWLLSSGGKLYLDRHWMSDVVGGTLAGVTVAALGAATYERCAASGDADRDDG